MNFKTLICLAIIILIPSAVSYGQKKATKKKNQPTILLDVGKSGQIVLTVRSKNAGTFSLIDAKGLTTHSGKWRDQNGHLTWKSLTGEPPIEGKTFRMEGAWRVHWKTSSNTNNGHNQLPFNYAASNSATIRDAQLKTQPKKTEDLAVKSSAKKKQTKVMTGKLVKKRKQPLPKKRHEKIRGKRQSVAVLCFGSKTKKTPTSAEVLAKN